MRQKMIHPGSGGQGGASLKHTEMALAGTGLGNKSKFLQLNRHALVAGSENARQAPGKEKSA